MDSDVTSADEGGPHAARLLEHVAMLQTRLDGIDRLRDRVRRDYNDAIAAIACERVLSATAHEKAAQLQRAEQKHLELSTELAESNFRMQRERVMVRPPPPSPFVSISTTTLCHGSCTGSFASSALV